MAVPGWQGSRGARLGLRRRAADGLSALIYPLSGRLGSSCCAGFPVFPPAPAPPWLCSGNSSDLVLWKSQILQIRASVAAVWVAEARRVLGEMGPPGFGRCIRLGIAWSKFHPRLVLASPAAAPQRCPL